ncbi:MAG TPA: GNAT family N-acetyltransferase [Gammaproteobacteria bacterium]|nr:GNAT family N-acetyltransferase [Gammaproteobacteria bacterium]
MPPYTPLPPIELSLGRPEHAQEVAGLSRDLIEAGLGWSWTPERVLRSLRHPDTVVLIAPRPGHLAGFAIMHFGLEEAHLNLLAVRPRYRRSGLGRRLVHWLEQSALTAGISVVYLETRDGNRGAQAFYRRLGYRRIGRVPAYYRGREAAVRMARDLWEPRFSGAPRPRQD